MPITTTRVSTMTNARIRPDSLRWKATGDVPMQRARQTGSPPRRHGPSFPPDRSYAGAMRCLALAVSVVLALGGSTASAAASTAPDPSSLASIGDSITRATNAFGWYGDHPSFSWSTGFDPVDGLETHYERLLRDDVGVWGHEVNVARAGARMSDAPAQAARAVVAGADYVTILMGANDVCARSVGAMTPVPQFANAFERTLQTLAEG